MTWLKGQRWNVERIHYGRECWLGENWKKKIMWVFEQKQNFLSDFFFLKILKYTFLLCDRFDQTCTTFFFLHLQLQKLEFEEFLELLGMSVQMSLDSIDAKLIPFLNMNFLWYSGLFKRLQAKYPDTHRCFTSSDGLVQYIVSCHAIKSNTVCTDVFRVRFWLN